MRKRSNSIIALQIVVSSSLAMFLIFFAGAVQFDWTNFLKIEKLVARASTPAQVFSSSFGTIMSQQAAPLAVPPLAVGEKQLDENALSAETALVMDPSTATLLYEKRIDKRWPIASITKLVTAAVALDVRDQRLAPFEPVTIQEKDIKEGPLYFAVGDTVAWNDVFNIMLVGSSNSAAQALVRSLELPEGRWETLVNEKLISWGLQKTQIIEPTGLSSGNISTAREIAKIFERAVERKEIYKALSTPVFSYVPLNGKKAITVGNTNLFLSGGVVSAFSVPPIGKTGFIDEAGYNLVALVQGPQGQKLVGVVMGASGHFERFTELEKEVTWALQNYTWPAQQP